MYLFYSTVKLYEVLEDQKMIFIVMEYTDGGQIYSVPDDNTL